MRPCAPALAATTLAFALAGCGGSSRTPESATTATTARTTAKPRPAAPERDEPPARLPRGWQLVVDKPGGFSFGVPRGWRTHRVQSGQLVRSADNALAISVSYDRTAAARTVDLRTYASRVAHALRGYRDLRVAAAQRIPGQRHPTVTVLARGVFLRTHVRQSILVIAVRRPQRGTFNVLAFRSARTRAVRYAPEITELVNTLRTRH